MYGNWDLVDETGKVYIYGTLDKDGKTKNFESLGLEAGDVVEVEGPKLTYGTKVELVDVTVLSIKKSLLKIITKEKLQEPEGGEIEVKVAFKGDGLYPVIAEEAQSWLSISGVTTEKGTPTKIEPNPADTAYVKITVAENPEFDTRNGIISFTSSKLNDEKKLDVTEMDFTVSQKGQPSPDLPTIATIASILEMGEDAIIPADTFVEGIVISNMDLNNLTSKKGMYIQDETGAIQLRFTVDHTFAFGEKLKLDLSGAKISTYNKAIQISLANENAVSLSTGNSVAPKTVTMADFLANKYEGQYVALEGVQVVEADLTKTWGDATGASHVSINMEDASGNTFVVFSSKYSTFGATPVAQGSGTIKGIAAKNNDTIQIIFAQESDFAGLTGERLAK